MSRIEKFVSSFVPQQFPLFYKDEGPNFIAFVKAYYEWLESNGQTLNHSRSLFDYNDIDTTEAQFLTYFKNTYLNSLPESILVDKKLLVKHILDLYRSKGTPRSYELLFRILFNESIELFTPGSVLFKPSDGEWTIPRYIEVSDNPYLENLIGKQIYESSGKATAVVESINQKIVNNRLIYVVYLSSIDGRFKFGQKILSYSVPEITLANAPVILGSLTAVAIENGGAGFNQGDIVDVYGQGISGKARIAAVRDENGKVNFNLVNGGSGYSIDAVVTVATAINLTITNPINTFIVGEKVTSSNTNANGTVVFANNSLIKLINFSSGIYFNIGDTITNGGNTSAIVYNTIGGGGTGATFSVGGLVNKEILSFNTDYISNYLSANLSSNWAFPKNQVANLNSVIIDTLTYKTVEVGQIAFLSNINPGSGYSVEPYIDIIEPDVAGQGLPDGSGGIKGHNALVSSIVTNAKGIVTAVDVINSGFGFSPIDTVYLSSPNNQGIVVTGSAVVDTDGVGDGYWKNNKSFLSDVMKIQDSYYYQNFSYEILVNRMLGVYEKLVKDLIHPSGIALFGRFRLKNEIISEESEPEVFIKTKYNIFVASSGQTLFTPQAGYTVGNLDIYRNYKIIANTSYANNTADVLTVTNANTYIDVNDPIYYSVPTGNTAISNLTGNTYYYVTFANSSSIALSTTIGGTNANILETRTGAGEIHEFKGIKLSNSEFTATNGVSVVLNSATALDDIIEIRAYS
jgi:hypothetical protein